MFDVTGQQASVQGRRPKQYQEIVCEGCGQTRPHMSRGLCKPCYDKAPRIRPGCRQRTDDPADVARAAETWGGWFTDELLPRLERYCRSAWYKVRDPQKRDELTWSAVERAWLHVVRLAIDGLDPSQFVTLVMACAVRDINKGLFVDGREGGYDAMSEVCSFRNDFGLMLLDGGDCWWSYRNAMTPADEAAFRADLSEWLAAWPADVREVVSDLADGHTATEVCSRHQLAPRQLSQLRRELAESWAVYQRQCDE